jgi:hypothetical protein
MIFGVVIVAGFMIILGIVGFIIMHFLKKGLTSQDAEVIDAKPNNLY